VVGLLLALSGSLSQLAGATSFLILVIFSLMNGSLILIRRQNGIGDGFHAPRATPYVALACCVALLCFVSRYAATTALVITAVGALFACGQKRTSESAGADS
jgi:basic amino acid/polyamine antiporter, APA family